jgi:hypothetical protein
MSAIDKLVSALSPTESQEKRAEAHTRARAEAEPGGWLSIILDHHEAIERAFATVRAAPEPSSRRAAFRELEILVIGHAMAEEMAVYPAMAQVHDQSHANVAYTEQAAAKQQLAALEIMDPMSQDFLDRLGHLEGAVMHHVFEEESRWLVELQTKATVAQNERIADRYREEFDRYMGADIGLTGRPWRAEEPRSFTQL